MSLLASTPSLLISRVTLLEAGHLAQDELCAEKLKLLCAASAPSAEVSPRPASSVIHELAGVLNAAFDPGINAAASQQFASEHSPGSRCNLCLCSLIVHILLTYTCCRRMVTCAVHLCHQLLYAG